MTAAAEDGSAQTVDVPEKKVLELLIVDSDVEAHGNVAVHRHAAAAGSLVPAHQRAVSRSRDSGFFPLPMQLQ